MIFQSHLTNRGMDEHSEETQKYKAALTEQTRSLEVLDRNMQNVSREITAILGKIEEDSSESFDRKIHCIGCQEN